MAVCDECKGSGASSGTSAEVCPDCQGRGTVKTTQRTPFGAISSTKACPHCGGKGKIIKNPCSKCHGVGRTRAVKTVSFDIPAGIADGQIIRLNGQGDCGINGGPAGNLNITISVRILTHCLLVTATISTARNPVTFLGCSWWRNFCSYYRQCYL